MTEERKGDAVSDSHQRLMASQTKTDTGRVKEALDTQRPEMLERCKTAVASPEAADRREPPLTPWAGYDILAVV
jgi:hypothetical protein